MSRIGRKPIEIPSGVTVDITDNAVQVKGPKGQLDYSFNPELTVTKEDNKVFVSRPSDEARHRALHGLTRTLIANMVVGVSEGYQKTLEIVGVGYRAALKGKNLEVSVGYSHPVIVAPVNGITFEVPTPNKVIVKGIDKQLVGQVAANIRSIRPPEPYKGKGIKYLGEYVKRKAGKAAK